MIPEEKIAEVRDSIDLVALINEHVPLRRMGSRFVGLCPFHNEKTPSFGVSRGKQFYYCFGCHASGDAISFLVQHQGYSFLEAVEALAERAGIELPRAEGPEQAALRRAKSRREHLASIMERATEYYEAALREPDGAVARQALAERGVSEATAATFRLGYAPDQWDALASHLRGEGVRPDEAVALGLIAPRRKGDGHYDRFRHRLMFPVADAHGRVVAFSGRALPRPAGDEREAGAPAAKYINSPEGPLYTKGSVLFGLHQARVAARQRNAVVLCEGNFDLLAIHQAGFTHVLAPLGTAFTLQQAQLIRRYAETVTVVFDGDGAGRTAAHKAVELGQQAGLRVRVATLPAGEDPDSFARRVGTEAFQALIDSAPGGIEFLIEQAVDAATEPAAVAQGIRSLGPVLARIESPVERDLYVERVARRFGLSDLRAVRAELRKGVLNERRGQRSAGPQQRTSSQGDVRARPRAVEDHSTADVGTRVRSVSSFRGLEPEVLGAMLEHPQLFETSDARNFEELLTDPDLRAIFRVTANMVSSGREIRVAELLDKLADNPAKGWLGHRLSGEIKCSFEYANAALRDSIPRLSEKRVREQRATLQREILRARSQGDHGRAAELARERDELARAQRGGHTR